MEHPLSPSRRGTGRGGLTEPRAVATYHSFNLPPVVNFVTWENAVIKKDKKRAHLERNLDFFKATYLYTL